MEHYLESDISQFIKIINFTLINVTIVNQLLPMAVLLNVTHDNITLISSKSQTAMNTKATLSNLFKTLSTGIYLFLMIKDYQSMSDSVADLSTNDHVIPSTIYTWKLKSAIQFPESLATDIQTIIKTSSPDSDSILNSIKSLNLSTFSYEVASTALNVSARLSLTVKNSSDSIILDIKDNLHAFNESIMEAVTNPVDEVNTVFSEALSQVNSIFKYVLFYDGFR
jgi:hypothetical protein